MLRSLSIRNFALIKELDLQFDLGLTVMSGETGAGKSIFLEALGQIAGQRADRELVRSGEKLARIEAVFEGEISSLPKELQDTLALPEEELLENCLILSRELEADGRSTARINGRQCSISFLRECASHLIAIHAQNEQIRLYDEKVQAQLIDQYSYEESKSYLSRWHELRRSRAEGIRQLKQLGLSLSERERRVELLRFQINEIENANFKPGEVSTLREKDQRLSSLDRIREDFFKVAEGLSPEREQGLIYLLNNLSSELNYASRHGEKFQNLLNDLIEASSMLKDVYQRLIEQASDLDKEAKEAELTRKRLDQWANLAIKYGNDEESLFQFLHEAKEELELLLRSEERFHEIRARLKKEEIEAAQVASELLKIRQKAGQELSRKIEAGLRELNMPKVRFDISVEALEPGHPSYWGERGRDEIAFMISPNPGEPLKPLAKIASGGEVSRILLAIKSALAELDDSQVMLFDEIDSGLGGESATKVGKVLRRMASGRQVFVVTHSAQIAANANIHYLVYKESSENRTETRISLLQGDERTQEIARLLSGLRDENKSLALAEAMLDAKIEER